MKILTYHKILSLGLTNKEATILMFKMNFPDDVTKNVIKYYFSKENYVSIKRILSVLKDKGLIEYNSDEFIFSGISNKISNCFTQLNPNFNNILDFATLSIFKRLYNMNYLDFALCLTSLHKSKISYEHGENHHLLNLVMKNRETNKLLSKYSIPKIDNKRYNIYELNLSECYKKLFDIDIIQGLPVDEKESVRTYISDIVYN